MRSRSLLVAATAALAGAATAVLPAIAGSETTPTIQAVNSGGGYYGERHYWTPSQVTVASGGAVTISNATNVEHGVEWIGSGPRPVCAGSVPQAGGEHVSGTQWSGTCTFTTPGTYTFYCTVHHAEMTGTVTVTAGGTTTTTTTGGTTPTQPSGTTESASAPGAAGSAPTTPGSPFAGAHPLSLGAGPHARTVRGSVLVSTAAAGGTLEVDLLAARASLAGARAARSVLVGRLVRHGLAAGRFAFAVALDARARHALSVRHRLALLVRVRITGAGVSAGATTLTRGLVLRR